MKPGTLNVRILDPEAGDSNRLLTGLLKSS